MNSIYSTCGYENICIQSIPPHSQSHWRGETVKLQLINYLSVCVLVTLLLLWENTMTKSTYKRKSLFELNGFRAVGVHHNRGTWKHIRHGNWSRKPRSHILNHMHKAERVKEKWLKIFNLKAHSQWHTSSSKAALSKPSPNAIS